MTGPSARGGKPRSILITGGGTGLGAALALHYAAPGIALTLTGRRLEPLEAVAAAARSKGATVSIHSADVTAADSIARIVRKADAEAPLDLVIANAGVGIRAKTPDELAPSTRTTWDTNIQGVANTVFPALDLMRKRQAGQIVIMSSLASFAPFPYAGAYNASKAAVRFFGEALRAEVWRDGITVTVICPGFVETPMTRKNRFPMPFIMTTEKAARIMAAGIEKGKGRIVYPWRLYAILKIWNALPYPLRDRLMRLKKRQPERNVTA